MRTTPNLLIAAALLAGLPAAATGQAAATDPADPARHWNQFRGPSGDGHSPATGVPVTFSATSLRWKTAIHDEGWSSPVVWGDQVWVTTAREDGTQVFAVAVDLATGEVVHDIKVFDVAEPQVAWDGHNTHATPTPLIEAGRVYVHFGAYGTAALDTRTGEKLWERRDLKTDHRVRPASSPVDSGNALFLAYDGVDRQFAAALDKRNGKTIWLRNREIATDFAEKLRAFGVEDIEGALAAKPNDNRKAYATSTVIEHEGRRQLVSPAAEVTFAYDPETGEELWRVVHEGWGWNVASRPVYYGRPRLSHAGGLPPPRRGRPRWRRRRHRHARRLERIAGRAGDSLTNRRGRGALHGLRQRRRGDGPGRGDRRAGVQGAAARGRRQLGLAGGGRGQDLLHEYRRHGHGDRRVAGVRGVGGERVRRKAHRLAGDR